MCFIALSLLTRLRKPNTHTQTQQLCTHLETRERGVGSVLSNLLGLEAAYFDVHRLDRLLLGGVQELSDNLLSRYQSKSDDLPLGLKRKPAKWNPESRLGSATLA